jgi:hypothetical protein
MTLLPVRFSPFLLLLLVCLPSFAAPAAIESVTCLVARPEQHALVSYDVLLRGEWTRPERSVEVALDLVLQSPSGKRIAWPAYHVSGASGELSVWRLRCALPEAGDYAGELVLTQRGVRQSAKPLRVSVAASSRRGFLRPAGEWLLRYDNGQPFRGLGQNICWEARSNDDSRHFRELHQSPRYHYEYMLGRLAAEGGNFFRTWMCSWNLPFEWRGIVNTDRYVIDANPYNASACRRMDELVALCDSLGIHMMLTLDSGGSFMGDDWERNAYNVRNGGPARDAQAFFTSEEAKAMYRDRLRALVARWGYSPSIAVWEFFNEVDNLMYGVQPRIPDSAVVAWHAEMAAFLKQLDPVSRLVSTSISHRDVEGLDHIPSIDFNQRHIYKRTTSIPSVLREQVRAGGKPYVIGEYGFEWDWSKDFNAFADDMDRDYRRGLWLGLFSPTPILPMTWWWEYFDSRGRTRDLAPVRQVLDLMLQEGGGAFEPRVLPAPAADTQGLAVACGKSLFVYVWNDSREPRAATLRLPVPASGADSLCILDPDTGAWSAGAAATLSGDGTVSLPLSALGHKVLILGPATRSLPPAARDR